MAQQQTPKQQHDELLADLTAGKHTFDGRSVLDFDEFTGEEGTTQAGRLVVSIQYAGKDGGGGGLLREYAFNPDDLVEQPADKPEKAAEKTTKEPEKVVDEPVKVAEVIVAEKQPPSSPKGKGA